MSKFVGSIVILIGLVILAGGACAIFKPGESADYWTYEEAKSEESQIPVVGPALEDATENPYEGDTVAQVGAYVLDIYHDIGIFDVADVTSGEAAEDTARKAGLSTAAVGFVILVVGGLVVSAGEGRTFVIQSRSSE